MAISIDSAFGILDDAVLFRAQRAEVLANNIANADTPNYKARDIEFSQLLNNELKLDVRQSSTHVAHNTDLIEPDLAAEMMYRIPSQASVDGNTVELQDEMGRYTENALGYQSSFQFLNRTILGLKKAITGE